jgi:Tfp pilus assembly protein PilF
VIRRNTDWRTEEVLYQKTLAEQPDAQLIRTDLGLVYWNNGDAIGAEREWVQAMGPERPYVPTLDNLGMLRTVQERYPEAIDLFQRAIRDSPLYAQAHKNLAAAYADTGKLADADREFRIAVELAPLNAGARNAYGHFLSDQGRDAEAEQQFRASIAADENGDAEESLGEILIREGDAQQAQSAFAAALALDSSDSSAHFGLAAIFERQGRIAEAISEYRAALNGDPQNAAALEALRRLAAAPDATPKNDIR